jgi:hypothetical protein
MEAAGEAVPKKHPRRINAQETSHLSEFNAVKSQFDQMMIQFFNDVSLAPKEDMVDLAEAKSPGACGSGSAQLGPVPIAGDPQIPLQALSCFVW